METTHATMNSQTTAVPTAPKKQMEQPKSILILQRVLVQYTLTEEDFKNEWAKDYTDKQKNAMWERLVNGDPAPAPFLPDPCIGDRGIEDFGTKTRVIELAETSNTALDADDHPELYEEVEEQLNDLLDTIAPEEESEDEEEKEKETEEDE